MPHPQPLRPAGQPVRTHSGEAEFRQAVAQVQAGLAVQREQRTELSFEEEPPPRRLAPFAYAVAAAVSGDDDAEIGSGRFVLLFDAAGQQGWDGKHRIIGYIRAELEPEMATDPLINAVGWSWLTEALDVCTSGYRKISGTVTTVVTQGFGGKQDEPTSTGFELRASWSPVGPPATGSPTPDGYAGTCDLDALDLSAHIAAWCDCLSAAAGLEPPGTRALRQPVQRQPGHG